MAERFFLFLMALAPLVAGCYTVIWPERIDESARNSRDRRSLILCLLPTPINVWFLRIFGLGMVALGCWLGYATFTASR